MANTNQITAPRVDFLDPNTGKISREWYMFLYNLYTITGAGLGITPVANGGTGLGTIPTNGQLLIGNGTGYALNTLGTGVGISVTNGAGTIVVANTGVLSNIAGTGISVSGTTGNVTISNTGVLSWSGGLTGLTPATATTGAVTLGGLLAIGYGGTNGTATPTAGAIAYGNGTAYAFTSVGTSGQVLTSTGAGTPTWTTVGTGTVTSVTGTTGRITSTGGTTPVIDLASGVATPGTTGSSTLVPVITIDTYGRVTSITTAANPQGTVTSVSGTGTVNGITLTGAVTSSGSLTLGGTLGGIGNSQLTNSTISGVALGGNLFNLTAGTGVSFSAGTTYNGSAAITITATGSGGTVTSVTGTNPVVSSGGTTPAISLATAYGDTLNPYASKTANFVLAAPNGSAGVPTFRALVAADVPGSALTKTDDTNVTLTLGGSPTTALLNAASLTVGWTGTLATTRGGTGLSSFTANGVMYASSTSALATSSNLTYDGNSVINGSSGTGTNAYGFQVSSSLTGATNNYGFYSNIATASNRWNFYANGTAPNYIAGNLGIGSTASLVTGGATVYTLNMAGNSTATTDQWGAISQLTATSTLTNSLRGFTTNLATSASAFTLPSFQHFRAVQGSIGLGSAVTNQYGFFADGSLISATNNYGFYSNIASTSNRYNFYAAGTAQNLFSGDVLVFGAGGLGYTTGSGGAVTQGTSRTTGVTINKTNGAITLFSAAGLTTFQSFTVTNSTVAATDVVHVTQKSGTDLYQIFVTATAAGSFRITFATTGGVTIEQPVFNFAVIKAVTA